MIYKYWINLEFAKHGTNDTILFLLLSPHQIKELLKTLVLESNMNHQDRF